MNTWKDTVKRALRTFLQAALGYAAANAAGVVDGDGAAQGALAALLVAAVASGLAALMNLPARSPDVEFIEGPAVVKKAVESVEDLQLAGQTSGNMPDADAPSGGRCEASEGILRARAGEDGNSDVETPVRQDEPGSEDVAEAADVADEIRAAIADVKGEGGGE